MFAYLVISTLLLFIVPVADAETFTLEEIIVKGETEGNPEDALDIHDIRKTPARDLGEAVDAVEGVSFIRKGAIANDIVLRGFGRENLNVLIDGARIYGACPNRMDPAPFHVDFAEIERITVLKGPFDVENAGSLGGTINAKTLTPMPGAHADLVTLFGSYENVNASGKASCANERVDAIAGYSYKYSLPYKDAEGHRITELYPPDSPNRYRPEETDERAYVMNSWWTKAGFQPFEDHRMEASYTRQEADDVRYPYLLMDAEYDDTNRVNWSYEIRHLNPRLDSLRVQAYWNNVRHDMTDAKRQSSFASDSGYSMRTFAETEILGGKADIEGALGSGQLSAGMDCYFRNWDAETTLPTGIQDSVPDVETTDIGAYFEYMHPVANQVSVTLGGRVDYTELEAGENRGEVYRLYYETADTDQTEFLGSGNMQILFRPNQDLELFTGVGISVRPPDPVEQYFALLRPMDNPNWVGNPGLDPVQNREVDTGLKYAAGRFRTKFTLFYSDVKDYIAVVNVMGIAPAKPARSYRNVDATLYGGEFTMEIDLRHDMVLRGGMACNYGRDDSMEEPLAEMPPLEGAAALKYDPGSWFIEVEGKFADNQDRVNEDLQEMETPGWGVANFTAGAEYKFFSVVGGVQNLFDKQYVPHLSYQRDPFRSGIRVPEIGRSFFITISCKI